MRFASPLRIPALALQYTEFKRAERGLSRRGSILLFASARDRDLLLADVRRTGLDPRTSVVKTASTSSSAPDLTNTRRRSRCLHGQDELPAERGCRTSPDPSGHAGRASLDPSGQSFSSSVAIRRSASPRRAGAGGDGDRVRGGRQAISRHGCRLRGSASLRRGHPEQGARGDGDGGPGRRVAARGRRSSQRGRVRPPLVVAHSPGDLARRIVERLAAGPRAEPDRAARAYVEEHFVWHESARIVAEALAAVVPRPPTPVERRAC